MNEKEVGEEKGEDEMKHGEREEKIKMMEMGE